MRFNYQARSKEGNLNTGFIEASSKDSAVAFLQKRGLYVTFLEDATPSLYAKEIKIFKRITKKEIVLLSRQLAIMFKAKVSLIESLKILSSQTKNSDLKEKLFKISEDIEGGVVFSQALLRFPKIFSPFYIAMVRSGEVSGKLSDVLSYLAEHLEREYHLSGKVKGALIYPCLIIFIVLLVLVLLIFFVVPSLIEVFEASQQDLPLATRIVISLTDTLTKWWWLILLSIILSISFFFKYISSPGGRKVFDSVMIKIPIIGSFLRMVYLTRLAENLSTLISSGLPISQALEISADVIGNACYREVVLKTQEKVRRGEPISLSLGQSPELFSPIFIQMILVGERTGTLGSTLMNIVEFYQKEVDRSVNNILSILEPALIIFLGFVVTGLMLSVLLPLYQTIAL